jgi:hypothetical protein
MSLCYSDTVLTLLKAENNYAQTNGPVDLKVTHLVEENGITTLIVKTDVPAEQEETFNVRFPQALMRVKTLAEGGSKNVI